MPFIVKNGWLIASLIDNLYFGFFINNFEINFFIYSLNYQGNIGY